ncbi:MAG: hypothetical protein FJY85_09460 [Deltaproteobacteria bacterium]|nr:hypothetical protein [Deltaproteobacteria bacterium]
MPETIETGEKLDAGDFSFLPTTIEVDVPKPGDMPARAQQVLCLLACGFSPTSIAKLAKITPQAVSNLVSRYDPDKKVTLTSKERRAFISQLWEARGIEALLHITPAKLADSTAKDLAGIAALAARSAAPLSSEKPKDPYALIEELGVVEG